MNADLIQGEVKPLPKRGITEETCAKFGYSVGAHQGVTYQIAPYYKAGKLSAQKLRTSAKQFSTRGDFKDVELFGQHLWREKGKLVVVTEGEIDCLTVSQLQGNKWPVVSLPNGAPSAKKAIQNNIAWLEQFESVVLMFDMDEPGQLALEECAPLFSPGKCKVARLPLKDANKMLEEGRGSEVIDAIWGAKTYRPDGLVSFSEIMERIKKPIEKGISWWLDELTELTYGRRYGELYAFGAGTGVGKTDFLTQQIAYDIHELGLKVGLLFLETPVEELGRRVAGKIVGKLFHVPDAGWTVEELESAVALLEEKGTLYDSFGQADWDVVKAHIRYMAVSQGIRVFYLDHLTALADTSDERSSLEQIMKEMAGLAHELDVMIHYVSHLSTPEGKPHEEGGRVMIRHFKGSRAIGFWSHFMFGLERNQQAEEEVHRQTTTFRVLKDRYTGRGTGEVIYLGYDPTTGRLSSTDNPFEESGGSHESPFPREKEDF